MHPLFSSTYSNPLFSPVHLSISLLKPLAPNILPHYFYLMCFIIASSLMAFYSLSSYGLFLASWHLLILQIGTVSFLSYCAYILIQYTIFQFRPFSFEFYFVFLYSWTKFNCVYVVIQGSVDGHPGCFHFLAIVNGAARNKHRAIVQTTKSFGFIHRISTVGSHIILFFSFLRNFHNVFHSECMNLFFHQQCVRILLCVFVVITLTRLIW